MDSGEESHGGCDLRLVMAERNFEYDEDLRHMFFLCIGCRVLAAAALTGGGGNTSGKAILVVLLEYRAVIYRVKV